MHCELLLQSTPAHAPLSPAPPELGEPHTLMVPAESSAANAAKFDAIETKPLPVGAAPVPPLDHSPHEWMVPEESSTAKARSFACCPLQ